MKIVIATHNKGKIREIVRVLSPLGIDVCTAELTEVEENGKTFSENALIKAKAACEETGLPCIADDSGLCVDHLNGAPGVYSARFAEPGKRKLTLLEMLDGVPDEQRGAQFACDIVCVFPNGDVIEAEGKCHGMITHEFRGEGGFGYDPIFMCTEPGFEGKTFAEMADEDKDIVSHRGRALKIFAKKLEDYMNKKEG